MWLQIIVILSKHLLVGMIRVEKLLCLIEEELMVKKKDLLKDNKELDVILGQDQDPNKEEGHL